MKNRRLGGIFMKFTEEDIRRAAPVTFGNVLLLTLFFWCIDTARRKLFTERPIKRITRGLEKISGGDFDTRIAPVSNISGIAEYNEIVTYINKMAAELGTPRGPVDARQGGAAALAERW